MGWIIDRQRLVYENEAGRIYPSAENIFRLVSNKTEDHMDGLPVDIYSPAVDLNIHFSRQGAKLELFVDFDRTTQNISVSVKARKRNEVFDVNYEDNFLPDSIVAGNTWYNLLSGYGDVVKILRDTEICRNGKISLFQYIQLRKLADISDETVINDVANEALSNHPVRDMGNQIPAALKADLYPYQYRGFQWMCFVAKEQCGCILGDEMGLGKTLQIIALIAERVQEGYTPSLVIAPVTLLENWRREFEKFTEGLNVYIHHGAKRTGLYTRLLEYDVIIISYNTACSDQSLLRMIDWDLIIVDEAQNIKNPGTVRTKSIKSIRRKVAIAVTGTPFENHITDLWSLMDFVMPGCLGNLPDFQNEYTDDVDGAKLLEPVFTPLMLRRRIYDVAQDLPEKIEIPQILQLSAEEALLYEEERGKIVRDFNGGNVTLPALQKLRMFCTHPGLLNENQITDPVIGSSKYQRLCELMDEIVSMGEKVVLFTSYNKMFEILKNDIPGRFGIRVLAINGSTPVEQRQLIVDEFSGIYKTALLILNPRAAGTGLNITAASRVIHYNPEWNPALEDQASARVYRRGQKKTVFIYRLYYKDTVEEVINERLDKKREMFSAAVVGTDGRKENSGDIIRALLISPGGAKDGK